LISDACDTESEGCIDKVDEEGFECCLVHSDGENECPDDEID